MKFIKKFNVFINEVINIPSELNKNQRFQNKKPIDVALLTYQEYYKIVNPQNKYHDNDIWDYSVDDMNKFIDKNNPFKNKKVLLRKKFGNLDITFYESTEKLQYGTRDENGNYRTYTDEEIKEKGFPQYEITIYAYHNDKLIGYIANEWGATLITIAKEYKGNGIGKILGFLFRKKHPDRDSGGFTSSGYKNIKNIYREFVKEYLRNGVYSYLVKKGELTKERVNEIIKSAELENYKQSNISDYAKYYNVDKINDDLIFWRFTEHDYILFDRNILKYYHDGVDKITEHFLKAHIYLAYNTHFENYELYDSYGISEKFEAMLLHMAFETLKKEEDEGILIRIVNDLSPQTLSIIDRFKNSGMFDISKKENFDYLKSKKGEDYLPLFKKGADFIKKHDVYDELSVFISELAYRMSDYKAPIENKYSHNYIYANTNEAVKVKMKYIGQCDKLRRIPDNESKWQDMMKK